MFCFDRRTKEHIFEFGRHSYEAYVLVSGLFFTLAVGDWLLVFLYVMLNLVQHLSAEKDERWLAVRS